MAKKQEVLIKRKRTRDLLVLLILSLMIFTILRCATPSILVTQEQKKGDLLFNNHVYDDAVKHYNLMLESSRKLGIYRNLSMESDVNRKIADCYEMMGNYEEALSHIHAAMVLDSTDNNLLGRIEDYRHEGKIFIYMGAYHSGIIPIEKSLALGEGMDQSLKNVHRITMADSYLALGQIYSAIGKMDTSKELTGKALSIFRQTGDKKGEMESYLNLGNIYSDLGDINNAKNFDEQSIALASVLKMGTARQYQLLSSISSAVGEYEDAIRFQEEALKDANQYRIMGQVIWATIGMGDIYRDLGDMNSAERFYRQAREIKDTITMKTGSLEASFDMRLGDLLSANLFYISQGAATGAGISSMRLAEIFIQNGKTDSAFIMLDQAGRMFNRSGSSQGIANVQLLKGRLLVDKREFGIARKFLDSAAMVGYYPETVWQAWYHTGRAYEIQGQYLKAIEAYMSSIAVIEKIRGTLTIDEFKSIYFDSKREVYDRLINLLLNINKPAEAFQVSEQARARAFYDIISNKKIDFRGSSASDLIVLEQEKRIEMQKLYKLLQKSGSSDTRDDPSRSGDLNQIRNSLSKVQKEYEEIVRKIKLSNPAYAEMVNAKPVSLAEIQSGLNPGTAVLEYWISKKELIIWLITNSDIIAKRVVISPDELGTLIEKTRISIQSNSSKGYTSGLSDLYKLLIGPFESDLQSFSKLIVVPNQSLHFLPFQALIDRNGDYLVQKASIVYAPSASVYEIYNDRMIKPGSRFMGMALSDIIVDDNVGLPGTEEELKKILPYFPDNISAFGSSSTESFFRKNAGNFNFLHLATHGSYNYRQPLYSCLLFPPSDEDDGRLNVFEVFELSLNAKLVTLSACETGLGNLTQGDELTGLSRAFLYAGASSVIVSLWSVADYSTSLLMADFYRYLKDYPEEEALRLAQLDVIREFPQPLYWSPFILVGNGNISDN